MTGSSRGRKPGPDIPHRRDLAMSTARLAIWSMLGLMMGVMIGVAGSTTYYQATDPASGRAYYTSRAKQISREEFDAALKAPAGATGEAPARKYARAHEPGQGTPLAVLV